ncbi:peptidase M24 [Leadbetterella byssophila DSM 17132]|uniref:Xaa-Pro aminopeptidase n=1 Tax=Leadbetterella byssophila (strain DSM 17132 / JCM 16389 / KACC 11308 / NBRC 106382 / 4M15) TaxID=649349 RepID=E4RVH1_LEAB4|nr:aminopeptidase P family protein [Leadbetterella byssophila]ADQ17035.1 peptidase M24 [Leadbetterella byssophila DSM 17132]
MKLFSKDVYIRRRSQLREAVPQGQILIMGNNEAPMNYTANAYRFRQDSNFLYFFGINMPGLAGLIDGNKTIIFGHELTLDDIIWEGPVEPLSSFAEKVGVTEIHPLEDLPKFIKKDEVHYLPPYRGDRSIFLKETLGISQAPSVDLIKAVVAQRAIKSSEEIAEMSAAVNISGAMHVAAMKACKPGKMEYEIVAEILRTVKMQNAELSYPIILSVNGQTLHNHFHGNQMHAGQLMLNDSGAETEMYYAGDITRTYPVSGKFTTQQKDIYEIVLKMEVDSIEAMKPGVSYRDIHLHANRILIEGLKGLGLLQGDVDTMVSEGVGGMFMPHGLGHAIGLDVHDMEDLGEQYVGYKEGLERSTQLGLKSLRFAKELETGNVLTVEPGCYFIPELISKYKEEGKFKEFVNYSRLESYLQFGGVRIEDNVLVTENGHQILGNPIPKTVAEIENI